MSPEEQEISLVMQRDHLSPLELRHWREKSLEHPSNGVTQSSDKVVEHEFGIVRTGAGMSKYLLCELDGRKFEVRCRTRRKMDDSQGICKNDQ